MSAFLRAALLLATLTACAPVFGGATTRSTEQTVVYDALNLPDASLLGGRYVFDTAFVQNGTLPLIRALIAYPLLKDAPAAGYQSFYFPEGVASLKRSGEPPSSDSHLSWMARSGPRYVRLDWEVRQLGVRRASVSVQGRTNDERIDLTAVQRQVFDYLESAPWIQRVAAQ
ncbi:hypothetical protein [Deinococcus sp.]|uniref:hypothetical protein n=1 Tax=Deinococcus sp. TaxID=47478 RepID=UPI003CC5A5E3